MNKFGINTASNIVARLWSIVSIYIFIPLYIQILGETAYGLVSFFATLQGALNLLGLGLSNTLRREFAIGDDAKRKYLMLRSIENIYFIIGIIIILICSLGSSYISEQWLNVESLNPKMVSLVISLMGVSIALQLISNVYYGCLMGLEYQVISNVYTTGWSALKSIGALAIIYFVKVDLVLFYLWHIVSDIIYLILLRKSVSVKLSKTKLRSWRFSDFKNLKTIWKYTLGLLAISFISLINRQLDKIIISAFLTLTELGAYNLATTLGNLTGIFPVAVYTAIFPIFTHLATLENKKRLDSLFVAVNRLVSLVLSCMGSFIAIFSIPLIKIWTGSEIYPSILGITATLIVLAVAIVEFQEIPYALALAYGDTSVNLIVGITFVPLVGVCSYFGIKTLGLLGGGIVLLTMMTLQTSLYLLLVYKKYLSISKFYLFIRDFFIPLGFAMIIAYISKFAIESFVNSIIIEIILAILIGALTLIVFILLFARDEIKKILEDRSFLKG